MEVEERVAVSDSLLLIVDWSPHAVFSHVIFHSRPRAPLRLHQLVYLGVAGWTNATRQKQAVQEKNKSQILLIIFHVKNLPGIKSAEEEDDQTHNPLSVPPLHLSRAFLTRLIAGADIWDKAQQTGITPAIYHRKSEQKWKYTLGNQSLRYGVS